MRRGSGAPAGLATASAMMDDVPHANITEMYRLFRTLGAVQR